MAPSMESQQQDQQIPLEGTINGNASVNNIIPVALSDDEVPQKSRVTVVGSGNWGSVAAKLIASNTLNFNSFHGLFFLRLKISHILPFRNANFLLFLCFM